MVYIKQIIVITSLLLGGALAAPVPDHGPSVVDSDIRAHDGLALEAHEFNNALVVDIEARQKKTKTPVVTKTKAPKPVASSATPKKPTASSAAPKKPTASSAAPKPSATKTPSASGSKITSAPSTKTSAASGTKVASSACVRPTKSPRSLERREGHLRPTENQMDINEDLYVLNAKGESLVTNLSGCTALVLFDGNNLPSIFHMFCGDETSKTERAMEIVNGNTFTTKAYAIIANDQKRYDNAKKEIVQYAKGMEAKEPSEIKQALYKVEGQERDGSERPKWLTRAKVTSGSTTIVVDKYLNPKYNTNQDGGICK